MCVPCRITTNWSHLSATHQTVSSTTLMTWKVVAKLYHEAIAIAQDGSGLLSPNDNVEHIVSQNIPTTTTTTKTTATTKTTTTRTTTTTTTRTTTTTKPALSHAEAPLCPKLPAAALPAAAGKPLSMGPTAACVALHEICDFWSNFVNVFFVSVLYCYNISTAQGGGRSFQPIGKNWNSIGSKNNWFQIQLFWTSAGLSN